ncbi:MAG: hypothetical protein WD876_00830 [Candidatus Pacearchaeota archaeon]
MDSQQKRASYIQRRDEFKVLKSALESRMFMTPDWRNGFKKLLNEKRPRTDEGELICAPCDIVSMVPVERKYGSHHDLNHDYECEVCGGNEIGRYQ